MTAFLLPKKSSHLLKKSSHLLKKSSHYTKKSSHHTQTDILLVYKNILIKKLKLKKNNYYNIINIYTNLHNFLHKREQNNK